MKRLIASRTAAAPLLICASIAFAIFMLVSSGQLNLATLRSIDGPLDAQQVASIQLCTFLNIIAGSIISASLVAGILLISTRGKRLDVLSQGITAVSPSSTL